MAFAGTLYDDKARVLRINATVVTNTSSAVAAGGILFYRTGQDYVGATNAFTVPFSGGTAAGTCEIALGCVLPPPSHIVIYTVNS